MSSIFTPEQQDAVADMIARGGIGVLKTDTIYGIVASANDEAAVERVYAVRGRDAHKPCIVLIADQAQIWDQAAVRRYHAILEAQWPGKVSIILPAGTATPAHIHRGVQTVAYRLPADEWLRRLLERTGPLIAPSANPQGEVPAADIAQARAYFGEAVDFYVDGGPVTDNTPSQLLAVNDDGTVTRLR